MSTQTKQAAREEGRVGDRRAALEDAIDILSAAYSAPCPPGAGSDCPKCTLLDRVLSHVDRWLSREIDLAVQAARAQAQVERAALAALLKWREADAQLEAYKLPDSGPAACAEVVRLRRDERERVAALRAAADKLSGAE